MFTVYIHWIRGLRKKGTCFLLMIAKQVKVRHKHEIAEIAEITVYIQIPNPATGEITTPSGMQIRT